METRIPQEHERLLGHEEWVWADSAYPLKNWCQAPYKKYVYFYDMQYMFMVIASLRRTLKRIRHSIIIYLQCEYVLNAVWDFSKDNGHHCEGYASGLTMRRAYNLHRCGLPHAFIFTPSQ
jgi:hypothetical protein